MNGLVDSSHHGCKHAKVYRGMDAEVQAIPWMDQPALAPVGSAFCVFTPVVAFGGYFDSTLEKIGVLEWLDD